MYLNSLQCFEFKFEFYLFRWPVLHGDNRWRGHAAAFLKYVNLPPEVLRQGRVSQVRMGGAHKLNLIHQGKFATGLHIDEKKHGFEVIVNNVLTMI